MPIELLVPVGLFLVGIIVSIYLTNVGIELLEKNLKK